MVRKEKSDSEWLFVCESCSMGYADRKYAEDCEAWCTKHKSCNIEIIRHAVKK